MTIPLSMDALPPKDAAHPAVDGLEPGELPAASSGPATPQHMRLPA